MRKLALRHRPKMAVIHKKVERREDRKEAKALAAAKLGKAIEAELLQRLKQGTYGDIYNFPATNYNDVLDREQTIDEAAAAAESDAESEEERRRWIVALRESVLVTRFGAAKADESGKSG